MTLTSRGESAQTCFMCGRRNDGVAVRDKRGKLRWICQECGPEQAKRVACLSQRDFDVYETRAVADVASAMGSETITLTPEEFAAFVRWTIDEWCVAVRTHAESLEAPF